MNECAPMIPLLLIAIALALLFAALWLGRWADRKMWKLLALAREMSGENDR